MKKYIPEHMLTIAASIAPIVITASAYFADQILATDGIIGWGGLAVGLVSAIILLNSDAAVWKTKKEETDFTEQLEMAETEKSILNVKISEMQGRLDSAIKSKLIAEQELDNLKKLMKEKEAEAENNAEQPQEETPSEVITEEQSAPVQEPEEETAPAVPEPVIIEKKIIETVEKKEDFCGVSYEAYRDAVTSFAAQSLRPAFLIKKELLSLGEKNSEKYVDSVSTSLESVIYLSNLNKTNAPLQFEDCDLNDLIKECMKKVSATISEKKIGTLRKGLEMTVNTDRRWLSVAITHVLMNAVNHLENFGKIAVSGRKDDDGVYIVIEDSGNGSDDAELARLFEPGFVTEEEKKNCQLPNGMSLFIAKHAVEHIGGEIIAESIKGKGTRIHIRLTDKE